MLKSVKINLNVCIFSIAELEKMANGMRQVEQWQKTTEQAIRWVFSFYKFLRFNWTIKFVDKEKGANFSLACYSSLYNFVLYLAFRMHGKCLEKKMKRAWAKFDGNKLMFEAEVKVALAWLMKRLLIAGDGIATIHRLQFSSGSRQCVGEKST